MTYTPTEQVNVNPRAAALARAFYHSLQEGNP